MDAKEAIELLPLVRTYHSVTPRIARAIDLAIAALEREHAERWITIDHWQNHKVSWAGIDDCVLATVREDDGSTHTVPAWILAEDDEPIGGEWPCDFFGDPEGVERLDGVTHLRPLPAPAKEESRG